MPDKKTVAIGALYNDGNGINAGHVRIYRWNGSAWIQKGIDIDGEAAGDRSGISVSMSDSNTVAIGARENDDNGNNAGQVRIYRWNQSAWVQKGIDIDGEAMDDQSGSAVVMPDSNTVAIGAHGNDGNGSNAGHVRIYRWNGNTWMQKGVDIDGETVDDYSGWSVDMSDSNTVVIGAIYNDGNGSDAGHVRIYGWNGNTWVQKGIDIDGEAIGDWSGYSVNMPDGNTIAIGARLNNGNGTDAGHVRIYRWNGSVWAQKGVDIDGEAFDDWSGYSVSMSDSNTVAIGATGNDGNGINSGHVRIYQWNGSVWIQHGIDINGEAPNDFSGYSISMPDNNTIAIGAANNDGNGSNAGHTRVYSFCSPTSFSFSATVCDSYTWPLNSITYTSSTNTPTVSLINAAGCDSLVTLDLTINTVDVSVSNTSPTLSANAIGAIYQWLDCANSFSVIPSEINQNFTATVNGSYAVEVIQNGCKDTSACQLSINVGVLENDFGSTLILYPNPSNGEMSIDLGTNYMNITITIRNPLGQEISQKTYSNIDILQLNIPGETGVYFIEIGSDCKKAILKVIKG